MGYEVFLVKTQTNQEPFEEIVSPVPFPPPEELLARIRQRFPGCLDDRDPTWVYLSRWEDSLEFSMELNLGEGPIQCIMVVHPAGRDSMWVLQELCRLFQCRAFDDGGWLDFEHPQGWLKKALEESQRFRRDELSNKGVSDL